MSLTVNIKKHYKNFTLDMNFELTGRRIGILGASGCGKSMTLRSIAGIHTPDEGRIVLGDRVLYDSAAGINLKPQVRNVGYLFQNYALFPNMTVRENIMAGLDVRRAGKNHERIKDLKETGRPGESADGRDGFLSRLFGGQNREMEKRADEMIAKFKLTGLEDRLPSQISGGQQQRVALARIMAYSPEVILLDEPFSALDWFLKDRMQLEMMEMLKDYDGMVIMVSHDRDEIYRFSEELLIVDEGRVVRRGETKAVFANPGTRAAAALTGCKNFSRAERIDDHHVRAHDWGITLETEHVLPEQFSYLGFRAHQFVPVYEEGPARKEAPEPREHTQVPAAAEKSAEEKIPGSRAGNLPKNAVRCNVISSVSLQFERNYYIRPETDEGNDTLLTWLVQRELWPELDERGMPGYLVMPEKDLLYLQ